MVGDEEKTYPVLLVMDDRKHSAEDQEKHSAEDKEKHTAEDQENTL